MESEAKIKKDLTLKDIYTILKLIRPRTLLKIIVLCAPSEVIFLGFACENSIWKASSYNWRTSVLVAFPRTSGDFNARSASKIKLNKLLQAQRIYISISGQFTERHAFPEKCFLEFYLEWLCFGFSAAKPYLWRNRSYWNCFQNSTWACDVLKIRFKVVFWQPIFFQQIEIRKWF